MAVKLADTLAPMGDFEIAEAKDISVNIGGTKKMLQKAIEDGDIGGASDIVVKCTEDQYGALLPDQKALNIIYCTEKNLYYHDEAIVPVVDTTPITDSIGSLESLKTTEKTNLVGAINEVSDSLVDKADKRTWVNQISASTFEEYVRKLFTELLTIVTENKCSTLFGSAWADHDIVKGSFMRANDNTSYMELMLSDHNYKAILFNGTLTITELATMDKVTKYPDYSRRLTMTASSWTATEDVYVTFFRIDSGALPSADTIKINNVGVGVSDFDGSGSDRVGAVTFNGYVRKGSTIESASLQNPSSCKIYPLI